MTGVNAEFSNATAGSAPSLGHLPEHPSRILLADDEHIVARGLAENLQELGYTVVGPAGDGDEAIALCRSASPDLALLDIRMGKRSGLDAAEVIFHEMGVPVVIFSAYSDQKYIKSGNSAGVFNYLLKPITQEQLRVAIAIAWGRFIDFVRQNGEINQLKRRLEHRKIIEQAKWTIVKRKDISEPEAMKLLQLQARNTRRPMVEVAQSVLESDSILSS